MCPVGMESLASDLMEIHLMSCKTPSYFSGKEFFEIISKLNNISSVRAHLKPRALDLITAFTKKLLLASS